MNLLKKKNDVVAPTISRVERHTSNKTNRRILDQSLKNIITHGADRKWIDQRLKELDREWDIERALEANASTLVVAGVLLNRFAKGRIYWLPLLVGGFLLQHAIQGWCPPVPIFRRLGFRTQSEIASEYFALRALRGDFDDLRNIENEENLIKKAEKSFNFMAWPSMKRKGRGDEQKYH